MSEIIISRPEEFEEKKKKIIQNGFSNFHILADFDLTLTKAFVDGQKSHSVIAQLRDGNYLSPDYASQAHALFDKYHPIEINPTISAKEKAKKMEEWWITHFKLLVECGLEKKVIEDVVNKKDILFRGGAFEFLDILYKYHIPLVIISSSGLGEAIPMYFEKKSKLYDNIHIISNRFEFDESGKVVGVKEPVIHVMNKSEVSVKGLPIYNELLKRKNVLLLGDSLGDLGMIEGFDYNNLISVGFLNENINANLERYKKNFDVVITDDGDFYWINNFLREFN